MGMCYFFLPTEASHLLSVVRACWVCDIADIVISFIFK